MVGVAFGDCFMERWVHRGMVWEVFWAVLELMLLL